MSMARSDGGLGMSDALCDVFGSVAVMVAVFGMALWWGVW